MTNLVAEVNLSLRTSRLGSFTTSWKALSDIWSDLSSFSSSSSPNLRWLHGAQLKTLSLPCRHGFMIHLSWLSEASSTPGGIAYGAPSVHRHRHRKQTHFQIWNPWFLASSLYTGKTPKAKIHFFTVSVVAAWLLVWASAHLHSACLVDCPMGRGQHSQQHSRCRMACHLCKLWICVKASKKKGRMRLIMYLQLCKRDSKRL